MPRDISQSQEEKYSVISLIQHTKSTQIHRQKVERSRLHLGREGDGTYLMGGELQGFFFNVIFIVLLEAQLCRMKKFWRLIVQQCEYT